MKVKKFFAELKKEIERIRWPNKNEMIKYSIITILFVIFFALFYFLLDLLISFIKSVF